MSKVYSFLGGRKMFWAMISLLLICAGAFGITNGNYETFQSGVFAIYASMVFGNLGSKFIYAKNNSPEN